MADNQVNNFFAHIETNIRRFTKQQKMTLSELSSSIGMTEAGFYKMLSTDSIKVKTLKKIAEVLNQPIHIFFEDPYNPRFNEFAAGSGLSIAAEPEGIYETEKQSLLKQIALLESQVADKNKIIELLSKK